MMVREWLKDHLAVIVLAPIVAVAVVVFSVNPPISHSNETALVIRNQMVPDQLRSTVVMSFVELTNGRTVAVPIPQGTTPPAPGTRINVMHNQRLLLGDSFEWIQ